jgi:cytochrome c-type biogenesis protein CcmH/NrfF
MPDWLAWTIPIVVVLLPFALMFGFNRGDRADSRGRRISRRWHR